MRQRVISAIIMLIIFIPLLFMGGIFFKLLALALALLGFKELIDLREGKYSLPLSMKILAFATLTYLIVNNTIMDNFTYLLDYKVIAAIALILIFPIILYNNNNVYNFDDAIFLLGNVFFLGVAFNLFILVREYSLMHIIYLFLITIMTDTYAYAAGRLIGKHKLIEKISPKKTWEGVVVGTIFGVLISSIFYYIAINDSIDIIYLIICTTILSIIGQVGDLIFSSIKRLYNKKDFSNIMPGHGGILDRFDSFIFVVISFVLFMYIL